MQDKKIFPLSRLSKAIEQVIQTYCSNLVWVKADIVKLNYYQHSGHAFPELAEKKEGRIVVEMRGTIWKKQFDQINQNFQEVLQEQLRDDMSVVMQVQVNYHAVYGLSVNILDMDPHYTLGELARQKAATIQRLKQEALFTANKQKPLPLLPKTLAVISVESSKGYQDFLSVLEHNSWGYQYHLKLFPAVLQGERAITTIISQLKNIQDHLDLFDAVLIVRGGGGDIGLSCYDNYQLSRAIASFPLPVITGIGHSTNMTVSEMVCYQSFITPTKVAEFLLQKFHEVAFPLRENLERIKYLMGQRFETAFSALHQSTRMLQSSTRWSFDSNRRNLDQIHQGLYRHSKSLIINHQRSLEAFATNIRLLSPDNILKKGYSISRVGGRIVQSIEELPEAALLETQLTNGYVISRVEKTEERMSENQPIEIDIDPLGIQKL